MQLGAGGKDYSLVARCWKGACRGKMGNRMSQSAVIHKGEDGRDDVLLSGTTKGSWKGWAGTTEGESLRPLSPCQVVPKGPYNL